MKEINITIPLPDNFIEQVANKVIELQPKQQIENKPKSFYSVKEVSKITEVNPRTVLNHINSGILKASKPGKSFLISEESLNKYIKTNE